VGQNALTNWQDRAISHWPVVIPITLALVSAGGIGAAVVAVRSGKAEEMAQIVLSGLFLNAVFGSVLLGFGMSAALTDAELKRYPLNRLERFTVRHIIGVVDPFWLLFQAIGSGLVVGLSIWGSYSLVSASVALLLFFFCSYSLTRALNIWMDQLLEARSGYVVVFALMMLIGFAPAMVLANFQNNRAFFQRILPLLRFTPPVGAATAITHQGSDAFFGLAVLAGWLVVPSAVITFVEHRQVSWKQTIPDSMRYGAARSTLSLRYLTGKWLRSAPAGSGFICAISDFVCYRSSLCRWLLSSACTPVSRDTAGASSSVSWDVFRLSPSWQLRESRSISMDMPVAVSADSVFCRSIMARLSGPEIMRPCS
jgi:hypothetical protein